MITLEQQKFQRCSEFSLDWNEFIFYESCRVAQELGLGLHPIAFVNDILYAL